MNSPSYFDETHHMIRETARKFVAKEITPYIDEWEEEHGGTGADIFQKVGG